MKVQILVDSPNSWIVPYAKELVGELIEKGFSSNLIHQHSEVESGDILCLLSCEKIFKNLSANAYNLVVHESNLPKGKGWSPVTWQVLDGAAKIPVTLFEAAEAVDAGVIYDKTHINLKGHELLDEIKHKQGIATKELVHKFVEKYPDVIGEAQKGVSTFYPRRKATDSELDITKSIKEQFNLLRVVDNERYPAYFTMGKTKYVVKIYKEQSL